MNKAKLCALAAACIIGSIGITPVSAFAAEANSESVTLSDKNEKQDRNRSSFKERMRKANENWNALTEKQKKEAYSLLEKEMKLNIKLMDKLVELGVFEKEDVSNYKTRIWEKYNKVIETGEFPLLR